MCSQNCATVNYGATPPNKQGFIVRMVCAVLNIFKLVLTKGGHSQAQQKHRNHQDVHFCLDSLQCSTALARSSETDFPDSIFSKENLLANLARRQ